jgi:hypothetical protein
MTEECISMVAFLFLLAPTVVLIAVLIIQRFQPKLDRNTGSLIKPVTKDGRIEPRFGAVNDNAERERRPEVLTEDSQLTLTG